MSFPPLLSINSIQPIPIGHEDAFNLIDWSLSDKESFNLCAQMPPDRLQQMALSKAFWNAAIDRWGMDRLVEKWGEDQLKAVVQALQNIPKNIQQSPRMSQALAKIFDSLIQIGFQGKDKLCACVNAMELDNIVPLIRSLDQTNEFFGKYLFAKALQDMDIPQQREFLSKVVYCYSTPERTLPFLSDAQLEAVLASDPVLLSIKRASISPQLRSHPELRFFVNNPLFSDVIFKVEGKCLYAHKVILASVSSYFNAMFYGGMLESKAKEIEFKELSHHGFLKLLEYLYTGRVEFNEAEAVHLLVLADRFELRALKQRCVSFIQAHRDDYATETLELLEGRLC